MKPDNHSSALNESSLLEKALSCSIVQNLKESFKDTIQNTSPAVDLSSLEDRLDKLSQEIKEFKETPSRVLSSDPHLTIHHMVPVHKEKILNCPEKPYELYRENILTSDEIDSLNDLLGYLRDNGDFISEKGHSVRLYGQPYSYTGSKTSEPDPIPPELTKITDKLCAELELSGAEWPNSILINHYPASNRLDPKDSHLALHSDDEKTIVADSKIITLSIGACRKICFEKKHCGDDLETDSLDVEHNSVYVMTRRSQNWYRHGVPPPPTGQDVEERFSITFRCLKSQFKRSMVVVGDSNTKEINFGVGSGKVGQSFPGKRIKAAKVKDIDPKECIGYSNIFIMSGTNDLRCENVSCEPDIHRVVKELQEKLVEVKQLCPTAKVFVIPVMPSRIPKMNINITLYNRLVDRMLSLNFPGIWFQGIYSFVDNNGLLSSRLVRQNDKVHLGPKGIAKLMTYMKTCVFRREKQESAQKVGSPEPT